MLECLIIGDSIAVGTHQFKPECVAYAKGGINSWQWLNQNVGKTPLLAKTVIISLGSNDHKGVKTYEELQLLRSKIKARPEMFIKNSNIIATHGNALGTLKSEDKYYLASRGISDYKELIKQSLLNA